MLIATLRIRRQLQQAHGLARWASIVAGPSEFWTVSVWQGRHAMQEFTRSGAHGQIMWQSARWLTSLWLMRWRPLPCERGSWAGLTLASPAERAATADTGTVGTVARGPDWAALHEALSGLPGLRDSLDPDGVATYEASRPARRHRRQVESGSGAIIRIQARSPGGMAAMVRLARLRRWLRGDPDLLRTAVGWGRSREVYFLAVWRTREGAARLIHSQWVSDAAGRWGGRFWAGAWQPESEFGHWDGLRLRRQRRRSLRSGSGPEAHAR